MCIKSNARMGVMAEEDAKQLHLETITPILEIQILYS